MLLQLIDIGKTFDAPSGDASLPVLCGVNLEVGTGNTVAIVGPSGSGKSTLLNIIGGLDRPTRGRVVVNGQELTELDDAAMAEHRNQTVGFIFQLHHLLPQCTLIENVLLPTLARPGRGHRRTYETRARELLEKVHLSDRLTHHPGELSGGERQRAAVARALINEPRILLADEPSGSLDRDSSQRLADLLISLNRSERVAIIMATHAPEMALHMAQVRELRDGTLQEPGGK